MIEFREKNFARCRKLFSPAWFPKLFRKETVANRMTVWKMRHLHVRSGVLSTRDFQRYSLDAYTFDTTSLHIIVILILFLIDGTQKRFKISEYNGNKKQGPLTWVIIIITHCYRQGAHGVGWRTFFWRSASGVTGEEGTKITSFRKKNRQDFAIPVLHVVARPISKSV